MTSDIRPLRTVVVDGVPVAGDARLVAEIERLRGQLGFARGVAVAALGAGAGR